MHQCKKNKTHDNNTSGSYAHACIGVCRCVHKLSACNTRMAGASSSLRGHPVQMMISLVLRGPLC